MIFAAAIMIDSLYSSFCFFFYSKTYETMSLTLMTLSCPGMSVKKIWLLYFSFNFLRTDFSEQISSSFSAVSISFKPFTKFRKCSHFLFVYRSSLMLVLFVLGYEHRITINVVDCFLCNYISTVF